MFCHKPDWLRLFLFFYTRFHCTRATHFHFVPGWLVMCYVKSPIGQGSSFHLHIGFCHTRAMHLDFLFPDGLSCVLSHKPYWHRLSFNFVIYRPLFHFCSRMACHTCVLSKARLAKALFSICKQVFVTYRPYIYIFCFLMACHVHTGHYFIFVPGWLVIHVFCQKPDWPRLFLFFYTRFHYTRATHFHFLFPDGLSCVMSKARLAKALLFICT